MKENLKIGMVDDHPMFMDGIKRIIDTIPGMEVCFMASSQRKLEENLKAIQPNILLLDLELPDGHGIDICEMLKKTFPKIKILILSMHQEERLILHLFRKGASGYLTKTTNSEELQRALFHLRDHEFYLSDRIGLILQKHLIKRTPKESELKQPIKISDREREVLEKMVEGKTSQEIADELFISKRTVDNHRNNLIQIFNARNAIDLVVKALSMKIVSMPLIISLKQSKIDL